MALKDWKKIGGSKNQYGERVTWKDKKTGDYLEVNQRSDGAWRLDLISKDYVDTLKSGMIKSQALAYAKQYMRTH